MMLSVLILTMFLLLPPSSSSSSGPSLVFPTDSPGYAQLEEITVDGDLTVSLEFRTGASEAQLLYMRETSAGHHISLSLSDGALHLQVHPDTLIVPTSKKTGQRILYNDDQWHNVQMGLARIGSVNIVTLQTESSVVETLPLLAGAKYETFIGGLPLPASEERRDSYAGCIRDINIMETPITDFTLSGAFVGECEDFAQDSAPVFTGSLTGEITETDSAGKVVLIVRAEDGDRGNPREILYELLENPHDYFALNQSSGELSLARQIDREAIPSNELILTVRASELRDGEPGKHQRFS